MSLEEYNSEVTVGTPECRGAKVSKKIRDSESFHLLTDKWTEFGDALEIRQEVLKKLRSDLLLEKSQLPSVISDIIEQWVGQNGSEAKLIKLEEALKDVNCLKIAEELRDEFRSITR